MRIVDTSQEVKSRAIILDGVEAKAAAENGTQVQGLQLVGLKVAANEGENARREVAIVADPALNGVGRSRGHGARSVVGGIHGIGVHRDPVSHRPAVRSKGQGQVLGLAVAPGEREPNVGSSFPSSGY